MSEDLNQVEVRSFEIGVKVIGQVIKVEEKQVLVAIQGCKLDGIIQSVSFQACMLKKQPMQLLKVMN